MSFDPYDHPGAYITFRIENGDEPFAVVHARTALFGLMYWNAHHRPQKPLPELPDFMKGKLTVFDTGEKCIGTDDAERLFSVAISVCERTWNKSPFSGTFNDNGEFDAQYDDEEKALVFLKWLREHGDIGKLKIRGEEYEVETQDREQE